MSSPSRERQTFGDKASYERCPTCHPERGEGSRCPWYQILRFAYERLTEIHIPTLIILGAEDDPVLFKHADKLEKDIAGVRRDTIPETHHMPNMEKPQEFNAIVLDFLDKLKPFLRP